MEENLKDLIDLMQSAMNDNSHESHGRSVISTIQASQECAKIAQSYADKQSTEFLDSIKEYEKEAHKMICFDERESEELLAIYKSSK